MRTVTQWLDEYGASHQNPTNKLLHWICVPVIVLCVFGLLASIPTPQALRDLAPWLNWGSLTALAAVGYYFVLSPLLAIGAAIAFVGMHFVLQAMSGLPWPLWTTSLLLFVLAWIGQFIGHAIEGKRPSFFQDVQFLMIGPLWLLAFVYRGLGVRYA